MPKLRIAASRDPVREQRSERHHDHDAEQLQPQRANHRGSRRGHCSNSPNMNSIAMPDDHGAREHDEESAPRLPMPSIRPNIGETMSDEAHAPPREDAGEAAGFDGGCNDRHGVTIDQRRAALAAPTPAGTGP